MKLYLYQDPDGYCYNSDSIFLFSFIKMFQIKGDILDIGLGVGVVSLLISKHYRANIYAVEKQEQMYFYAQKNCKVNGKSIKVSHCDYQEYQAKREFDFIVSNPPFYSVDQNQSQNRSKNIARYSHHLPLELFIAKSAKLLKPRGYFIFCYDASQIDEILTLLKKSKMQVEFLKFVHSKADKEAKIVMIAARKKSNARCRVLSPFITFNDDGSYTLEAKQAFKDANTHSIKAKR